MKKNRAGKNIVKGGVSGALFVCLILGAGCTTADRAVSLPLGSGVAWPGESGAASDSSQEDELWTDVSAKETENYIYVYVCGAVCAPGVVKLPEGSRGADALEAAGGFAENAGRDYINLAARLEDGQKLYFPTGEEARELEAGERREESGLVNINTADESQLCTLSGIGESRARDIIAYRESHGAFAKTEDIMKVSGIKESVYRKISGQITVD